MEPDGAGSMRVRTSVMPASYPVLAIVSTIAQEERLLHELQPVVVLLVFALHDGEVVLLNRGRDGARVADDASVYLSHGSYLGRGAAAEHLFGEIEVRAAQLGLLDGHT